MRLTGRRDPRAHRHPRRTRSAHRVLLTPCAALPRASRPRQSCRRPMPARDALGSRPRRSARILASRQSHPRMAAITRGSVITASTRNAAPLAKGTGAARCRTRSAGAASKRWARRVAGGRPGHRSLRDPSAHLESFNLALGEQGTRSRARRGASSPLIRASRSRTRTRRCPGCPRCAGGGRCRSRSRLRTCLCRPAPRPMRPRPDCRRCRSRSRPPS